jgi:glycosyltransferase involved in cell wall biosynthesis
MGYVTRRLAQQFDLPYVMTAHGSDVTGAEQSEKIRKRTESVVRDAAAVIAVSDELAMRLRKLYPGIDPVVSHMGIDTDLFMWASGDKLPNDRGPLIVGVGSLTANKNHKRLIEAVNGLENVRLVIIGEGPERDALQSLIEANDLGKRIALAGRVPLYELPAWFLRANACTLVSVREGFGLSALEGSACGARPVVSTTAPLARVVAHSGGVIVDPTSVDAISAGITEALALGRLSQAESDAIVQGQDIYTRAQVVLDTLVDAARHK